MATFKESFAGRWTLASMVSKGAASDGTYPMGRGSIHYDPKDNWMHAILETDPASVPAGFKSPTVIKFIVASFLALLIVVVVLCDCYCYTLVLTK